MSRDPAGLGSAPTGPTHIVRARVLSDLMAMDISNDHRRLPARGKISRR
jgi:hypothetical protein